MSETVPRELMILIERVVQPLPIWPARRRRLRAEFLEHLQAIYAEELARDGDEAAAMARTQVRFGNPVELSADLRGTISRWELLDAWLLSLILQRSGESLSRYAGRLALGCSIYCLGLLLALPLIIQVSTGKPLPPLDEWRGLIALPASLGFWMYCFVLFALRAGSEWGKTPRSWLKILGSSAALFAAWPISMTVFMLLAGGSWSGYPAPLVAILVGGLGSAIAGLTVGSLHDREVAKDRGWADLHSYSI